MGATAPSPADPASAAPPVAHDAAGQPEFMAAQEALRRAMPLQRLIGSGMRPDDAIALHGISAEGVAWATAAAWLGERNLRLAEVAGTAPGRKAYFRYASAGFRAAHAAIPIDNDEKRRLHAAMVEAFAFAAALDEPVTEKREIPWRGGRLLGWLARPAGGAPHPCVMILGGFDGWREEYWPGAEQLLARGIAVFLVDGPGQGESRLKGGLFFDADFHEAFCAVAETLRTDPRLNGVIGLWGNSLGGFLAARVAAADPRFAALCVNGGTVRPAELPERFPRFWEKVEAMVGGGRERAADILLRMDISSEAANIRAPLLQLHGAPDQVFLLENARRLHDLAGSADKRLLIWEDGDHCIYNHSEEKHIVVTDWFASQLLR